MLGLVMPMAHAQQTASKQVLVKVVDAADRSPVVSAAIKSGKKAWLTDVNGLATVDLPTQNSAQYEVSYIGYKTQMLTLSATEKRKQVQVMLAEDVTTLSGITVETQRTTSVTLQSAHLDEKILQMAAGKSIGQILESLPGVSSVRSGSTLSKPVIQGMHSTRVVLVESGIKLAEQDWGNDHAPAIDPAQSSDIEVIKGAESIRYGAGAIGGVILVRPSTLDFTDGWHGGSANMMMGTNGRYGAAYARIYGKPFDNTPFSYSLSVGGKKAGDYHTAEYNMTNTGQQIMSLDLSLGYQVNPTWQLRTDYRVTNQQIGVFKGSYIGTYNAFLRRLENGRPSDDMIVPFTYSIDNPRQSVTHHTLILTSKWMPADYGQLETQYAFQFDDRKEYHIRRAELKNVPAIGLMLSTHALNADWKSNLKEGSGWQTLAGVSGIAQKNTNQNDTYSVAVIPNFAKLAAGAYLTERYRTPNWTAEAGARFDYMYLNSAGYNYSGVYYGGKRQFSNFTGSIGGSYNLFEGARISTNLALAWRAPEVIELYSKGLHQGEGIFEIGDNTLDSERALKWNVGFNYSSPNKTLSLRANAFVQHVGNYIYSSPTRLDDGKYEFWPLLSGSFPVFRYRQTEALFWGGDAQLVWRPMPGLDLSVAGTWVRAKNVATNGYLPMIPADRYNQQVAYESPTYSFDNGKGWRWSANLEHIWVLKQNRFDPATDLTATSPDGYNLLGAQMGFTYVINNRQNLNIYLSGSNLLNKLYKEYTDRYRYYAHAPGRDLTLRLIYNF